MPSQWQHGVERFLSRVRLHSQPCLPLWDPPVRVSIYWFTVIITVNFPFLSTFAISCLFRRRQVSRTKTKKGKQIVINANWFCTLCNAIGIVHTAVLRNKHHVKQAIPKKERGEVDEQGTRDNRNQYLP